MKFRHSIALLGVMWYVEVPICTILQMLNNENCLSVCVNIK